MVYVKGMYETNEFVCRFEFDAPNISLDNANTSKSEKYIQNNILLVPSICHKADSTTMESSSKR